MPDDLRLAEPPGELMVPTLYRIRARTQDTDDTFTWELEAETPSAERFEYSPGQFNMLYALGVGEVPISISGDGQDKGRLIHTIRSVGTVTRRMHAMQVGDVVGVRGPFGVGWPVPEAEGDDVVLVAGGIGLAPLRPVLYHVLERRDHFGRVVLLYGARNPSGMIYLQELEQWRGRFDLEVEVTVDSADVGWHGAVGVVTTLIPYARFDPAHTTAMVCGPEIMMRFTARTLLDRGMDAQKVYISMERNMKCAVGFCGHCQWAEHFVCKDGPVFPWGSVNTLFGIREV